MELLARIMLFGIVGWYASVLITFIVPPFRKAVTPAGIVVGFVFAFGWQFVLVAFHWGGY